MKIQVLQVTYEGEAKFTCVGKSWEEIVEKTVKWLNTLEPSKQYSTKDDITEVILKLGADYDIYEDDINL